MATKAEKPTGLALLREPFPPHLISKLPKETGTQAKQRKADQDAGKWPPKCDICGGYHHPKAVHLDYVGHAALTDRLLDCDPNWTWEPCTLPGLPNPGQGMWITLTVCGVSRIGYGSADGKSGGDAIKEIIGDALRNAAMRFGAALDLWHKGDLHADDEGESQPEPTKKEPQRKATGPAPITGSQLDQIKALIPLQKTVSVVDIIRKYQAMAKERGEQPPKDFDQLDARQGDAIIKRLNEIIDQERISAATGNSQRDEILADEIPY